MAVDQCAADKHRASSVRCSKRGRHPAVVQPTTLIPVPAAELVCHWHQGTTVPARRGDPSGCQCCGRPL